MDLLTALWPYLMGALVGWTASWGLAHRFKYATDSTKTIRVEKVVEKVIEVDRQELVDRLAEAEALLREHQRHGNATRRRPPAKQPGEIGRAELIEKLTELESTVTDYGNGRDGVRPAAAPNPPAATPRAPSRADRKIQRPEPARAPHDADAELVAMRSAPSSAPEIEKLAPPPPEQLPGQTTPEKARRQAGKQKQSAVTRQEAVDGPSTPDTSQLTLPVERLNGSAAPLPVQAPPTPTRKGRSRKPALTQTPADTSAGPASSAADKAGATAAPAPKQRKRAADATQAPADAAAAPVSSAAEKRAPAPKQRKRAADATQAPADAAAAPVSTTAEKAAAAPATPPKKRNRTTRRTQSPADTATEPAASAADQTEPVPARDTGDSGAAAPASGDDKPGRLEIDWAGARAVGFTFKDPGERTDFTYIEGIGPKISTLLQDAGIDSYHHLASTSGSNLRKILDGAGPRYRLADPTSWPQQAAMIAESRWQALHDWKQQRQGKSTASETS